MPEHTQDSWSYRAGSGSILKIGARAPITQATSSTPATTTTQTTRLKESRMASKLREIERLRDGWWGSGSQAIDPGALALAQEVVGVLATRPTHVAIAPSADGSLMLEWSQGSSEFTAELVSGREMHLTVDSPDLDVYEDATVPAGAAALLEFFDATAGPNVE